MTTEDIVMETVLTTPTELEAQRYLRECSFEDRLVGVIMKASGTLPMDIYSLEHVLGFFVHDNSDVMGNSDAIIQERQLAVAYVAPERLARWIREIVGDGELADAVDAETAKLEDPNIYPPRMKLMRELVVARVLQCYEVLGVDPAADDEETGAELEGGEER